jgi:O-antigen/teichoic acid export membrane protein
VVLFYGKAYGPAGEVVFFTSFTALAYVIANAIQIPMISMGKIWDYLAQVICWTTGLIALAWSWIPRQGSLGLAGAYLTSYVVLGILAWQNSQWRMGLRFEGTIRIACLTLAAVAVAYLGSLPSPQAVTATGADAAASFGLGRVEAGPRQ